MFPPSSYCISISGINRIIAVSKLSSVSILLTTVVIHNYVLLMQEIIRDIYTRSFIKRVVKEGGEGDKRWGRTYV